MCRARVCEDLIENFNLIRAEGEESMMGYELLIIIEKQSLRKPNNFNYFPRKIRLNPSPRVTHQNHWKSPTKDHKTGLVKRLKPKIEAGMNIQCNFRNFLFSTLSLSGVSVTNWNVNFHQQNHRNRCPLSYLSHPRTRLWWLILFYQYHESPTPVMCDCVMSLEVARNK